MRSRSLVVLLALVASLSLPAAARADGAYDKVAAAYAQAGGHLDPCAFTEDELKAAVSGIPPEIRNVVPALRAAMVEGIAAHARGDCKGKRPEEGTTGGAAPGATPITPAPAVTTPPVTTPPVTTQTAPAVPAATTPTTPTTTAPAPAAEQSASDASREHDSTPLVIALIVVGTFVLLALLLWGVARMRGWDPTWVARLRHGWSEAGFRTTSTWSEFTDWLRLGR